MPDCLGNLGRDMKKGQSVTIGKNEVSDQLVRDFDKAFPDGIRGPGTTRLKGKDGLNRYLSRHFDSNGNLIRFVDDGFDSNLSLTIQQWQGNPGRLRRLWKETGGKLSGVSGGDVDELFSLNILKDSAKTTNKALYRGLSIDAKSVEGIAKGDGFNLGGVSGFSTDYKTAESFAKSGAIESKRAVVLHTEGTLKATDPITQATGKLKSEGERLVFSDSAKITEVWTDSDGIIHLRIEVIQ